MGSNQRHEGKRQSRLLVQSSSRNVLYVRRVYCRCSHGWIEFSGGTPFVPKNVFGVLSLHCAESSGDLQEARCQVRVLPLGLAEFNIDCEVHESGGDGFQLDDGGVVATV